LSVSLRPSSEISVSPSVSLGRELYPWSASSSDTGSVSVTVTYMPAWVGWRAWSSAAYTRTRATDRSADARDISVGAGLSYDLGKLPIGRASIVVEVGYDRYLDGITPAGSSRSSFGFLLLRFAQF